jgi:hypothetical protein
MPGLVPGIHGVPLQLDAGEDDRARAAVLIICLFGISSNQQNTDRIWVGCRLPRCGSKLGGEVRTKFVDQI